MEKQASKTNVLAFLFVTFICFTVTISYCKYNMGDTRDVYEQGASTAFPNAGQPSMYTLNDVDSLAEYSAGRYAKTAEEYQHYLEYYRTYFTQQISEGNTITLHQDNQMDSANAAAAVAQSAIQQIQASRSYYETNQVNLPSGTDNKRYRKCTSYNVMAINLTNLFCSRA